MNKLEINYEIVGPFDVVELVKSPNLTISVGLIISVVLGPNVFSIENHKTKGNIKLEGGAVSVNGEWMHDLGYTPFLFPLELTENVTYAKLG